MTFSEQVLELTERERFSVLRKRLGLKQTEIAEAAGVSRLTVTRWEAGMAEPFASSRQRLWAALEAASVAAGSNAA